MKKLVLTITATLACVAAFAQGKVSLVNDSLHLVYFDAQNTDPADASLRGQPVGATNTLSGPVLAVDLYQGAASGSLAFVSSTTVGGASPGRFGPATIIVGVAAPTTQFYQVQLRDNTQASATAAQGNGKYYGFSQIFTCPSGSITPVSIVSGSSTWAAGTFDLSAFAGTGAKGAIDVQIVPEPSTFVLAGLGAAALLVFRRRK